MKSQLKLSKQSLRKLNVSRLKTLNAEKSVQHLPILLNN